MASTDPNPTDPTPISIIISDPEGGTLTWVPGPHGQEHLQSVPEEDRQRVNDEVEDSLRSRLQGMTGAICGAVHPEFKEETEELIALMMLGRLLGAGSPRFGGSRDPFGDDPFDSPGFPRGF